ncbi:MAG: hypothetical protein KDB82_14160 [Planctomycetes bacterium]|nr:hypothetical protein [Planctomycetota bacterium]
MSYVYKPYPISEYINPGDEILSWSSEKTNHLYQRFLETKTSRVIGLLWYLDLQNTPFGGRELVAVASIKVRDLFLTPIPNEYATARESDVSIDHPSGPLKVASQGDVRLTSLGETIAIDLALLLADSLVHSTAYVWRLYKSGKKRDVHNNFPVISLDEDWKAVNPFVAGPNFARRTARGGERAGNEWLYQYDRLVKLASEL